MLETILLHTNLQMDNTIIQNFSQKILLKGIWQNSHPPNSYDDDLSIH